MGACARLVGVSDVDLEMTTVRQRWYRLPVLWLGAAVLLASIAGCISMIVLASRYPDEPVAFAGDELLKVPQAREPASHDDDSGQ